MTLHANTSFAIPEETVRVAHAAYPHGNIYLQIREVLGPIYHDQAFAHLFPHNGRAVEAPWRLAMITVMQYAEELSDRQAADAVRGRIDWKYMLGLELADPGFDASVLSTFRKRLVQGNAELLLLETLLERLKEHKLLKAGGRQRSDSTHVLAKIRAINRVVCVGEAMRFALNSLAEMAPTWLVSWFPEHWVYRYGARFEDAHLPKTQAERQALAEAIGRDGEELLTEIFAPTAPSWLRELPEIDILRRIWIQNYLVVDGALHWRTTEGIPPPTLFLSSPYDQDARLARKGGTAWVGYKIHVTETCDEDTPHVITHVASVPAPAPEESMPLLIEEQLRQHDLVPAEHLMDAGYITAETLVEAQERFGVEIIGPTRAGATWEAGISKGGYPASAFVIDWEQQQATCPQGHPSKTWSQRRDCYGHPIIKIGFSPSDCRACPARRECITSKDVARSIHIRTQKEYLALQRARQQQSTPAFVKRYNARAGIEGTISQGVRAFGLRRSRYLGLQKTHLFHLGIAAAIDLVRVAAWLNGKEPEHTRQSAFLRLMSPA